MPGQQMTALEIINEVRRKTKLNTLTSTLDTFGVLQLEYLNDVIDEVSDYGNWQETLVEINVTAQSSVANYTFPASLIIQNVHEVVFNEQPGEMRKVDLDTIRRLGRSLSYGQPQQWAIVGTDENANPIVRVSPVPSSAQSGLLFNMLVYQKPDVITTAQVVSAVPPFDGKMLVKGLLAKIALDESDGEPSARSSKLEQEFQNDLDEVFNRYNGDTGSTIFFRPSRGRR